MRDRTSAYTQGLTTTSNDKIVFAAGSDSMLRAWSTVSGQPLRPIEQVLPSRDDESDFQYLFDHKKPRTWDDDDDAYYGGEDDRANEEEPIDLFSNYQDAGVDHDQGRNNGIPAKAHESRPSDNPLARKFPRQITALTVQDDGGLDVACGRYLYRYGRTVVAKRRSGYITDYEMGA